LIALLSFSRSSIGAQPSNGAVHSVDSASGTFVVPVKIDTTGEAWNGYLAFGLWQYNSTNLSPLHGYLVVMTTSGQLLYLRRSNDLPSYWPVKYTSQDTLMFMGEPDSMATHFWHMAANKTDDFMNVWGHHDIEYNLVTHTFHTLRDYIRTIAGKNVLMDRIVELSAAGVVLWTWDTYADGHFSLNDECPCNDTAGSSSGYLAGPTLIDLTHSNSLQWDISENIIYLNMRALNTFCKIDKTTSQVIWCIGQHGDFALYNAKGKKVPSLWYHAHDVREVQPGVFSMFDNEYHNTTLPCEQNFNGTGLHSRMLEITVSEQNMTAHESWSWSAPSAYWTPYWGSVNVLPNADMIAAFGSQSHYVPNSVGAELVEVNLKGEVVRTYTFPYGWGIYRIEPIGLQTVADYDGTTHTGDFKINLSTLNGLGGIKDIYYRINNGTTKSVQVDGQPEITTEGANNTLEYWSVDNTGIEETPHRILTGIRLIESTTSALDTNSPLNNGWTEFAIIFSIAIVLVLGATVYSRKIRRHRKNDVS
jgi:hypothetical protein